MTVISPQPWFPLQGLIRRFRPHFRPSQPRYDTQSGIEVLRPRYFSVPGVLKRFDGLFMALGARRTVRRLRRQGRVERHRCAFRLSRRLRGVAGRRVGRGCRSPSRCAAPSRATRASPRCGGGSWPACCWPRLVSSPCPASLKRWPLASACRRQTIRVVGNGVDSASFPTHAAGRGAACARHRRRGSRADHRGRAGRAQGLSPRDRLPAGALPAVSRTCSTSSWARPAPRVTTRRQLRAQVAELGLGEQRAFPGRAAAGRRAARRWPRPTCRCSPRATKAGPTCCWRRWPAACRWSRPTSAATPRSSAATNSARSCRSATTTRCSRPCGDALRRDWDRAASAATRRRTTGTRACRSSSASSGASP